MPRKTTKAPIEPARRRQAPAAQLHKQDAAALAAVHAALDTPEQYHEWPASPMGATELPPVAVIDTRKMLPENEL